MSKQKASHKSKTKVTDITDLLTRFDSKRSRGRTAPQEDKPEESKENKRTFYSEEDDELWVNYIKGGANQVPNPPESTLNDTDSAENDEVTDTLTDTVKDTVSDTEINSVESPLKKPYTIKERKQTPIQQRVDAKEKKQRLPLDATHTPSESKLYSLMYRETISKGISEGFFSIRRLVRMSGINSVNTVRKALQGLRLKRSIELVEDINNSPLGTRYRVFHPRDIFHIRDEEDIQIDMHTKKVVSVKGRSVSSSASSTVSSSVASSESPSGSKNDTATVSATVSKFDTVKKGTPYIYINNEKDDSKKDESSSSNNIENKLDDDDFFDLKTYITALYERYTGNKWTTTDDDFYERVRDILPDIIEAAIIASVLRTESGIESFSSCEGSIKEYQLNLPPGYLGYLRKKWKERVGGEEKSNGENDANQIILPKDSYFQAEWLKNYISDFPEAEQGRIKKLAEQFDHFMLSPNQNKDWIKNPTGAFVGLVHGKVNVPLSQHAPSFEDRLEEQRQKEEETLKEEQLKREREGIEAEVRDTLEALQDQEREKIIKRARELYDIYRGATDEDVIERIVYKLLFDHDEGKDWKESWEELKG